MSVIKKILLIPVYVLALFTQAKSFKSNPVIGSRLLNMLGLHVVRVVISHGVYNFKLFILSFLVSPGDRRKFKENGYIVKEGFLPKREFETLKEEVLSWNGQIRQNIQGSTLVYRSFLHNDAVGDKKSIIKLKGDADLLNLLKFTSGKNEVPRFYIEQVRHDEGRKDKGDPQHNLHSDTFHPTVKAWLFLDDVSKGNGPFKYVPGSHKLTWRRLKWEYRRSMKAANINDGYSEKGSFRADDKDLEYLGLGKAIEVKVPKNSLVIANTNGFHCRGKAARKGAKRLAVWASSRVNPFNPLIGFDFRFLSELRDKIMVRYQQDIDNKAKKKGVKPSWHVKKGAKYSK